MQNYKLPLELGRALAIFGILVSVGFATASQNKGEVIESRTTIHKIASQVVYEFSRTVEPGRLKKAQVGSEGQVKSTYTYTILKGKVISKRLVKKTVVPAKDTIYLMGRSSIAGSRHGFVRSKVRIMSATAYDPSPATIGRHATGRTRTGVIARLGCIAVDPRVIPLGTLLYVEGYGFGIANDTGGAIKGNRIDLCYASKRTADRYGRKNVRVHILRNR